MILRHSPRLEFTWPYFHVVRHDRNALIVAVLTVVLQLLSEKARITLTPRRRLRTTGRPGSQAADRHEKDVPPIQVVHSLNYSILQ